MLSKQLVLILEDSIQLDTVNPLDVLPRSPLTGPPQPDPSTVHGQNQRVRQKLRIAAARQQAMRTNLSESDDGEFEMSVLLAL